MIVKFFKGRNQIDGEAVPCLLAIRENKVWKHSVSSMEILNPKDYTLTPDCQKIAELDFLDTEIEAVETLVDALVSSDILEKNSNISGESALYILVNETLVVLKGLMDDNETVMSEDFSLTDNR